MKARQGFQSLPVDIQKKIKDMYMEGYSISQLAKECGITRQALGYHIRTRNWAEERRLQRAELFQQFSDTKKAAFTGIYLSGTELLRKAVEDAKREYEEGNLSLKERLALAKAISDIITQLDKIQRLDAGSPTDIKEEKPFVAEDIQKRLLIDPFFRPQEAQGEKKHTNQASFTQTEESSTEKSSRSPGSSKENSEE